jgi:transposase
MIPNASVPPRVIGCDVGKFTVVVFDGATGQTHHLDNTPECLTSFLRKLTGEALVVCEATGGYEASLLLAASAAGVPAHRADARKVKAFIRSLGMLGKSDNLDARAVARYGLERHTDLPRWTAPDAVLKDLQALVRLRAQFVKQRAGLRCLLQAPQGEAVKAHVQTAIEQCDHQIQAIENDITSRINADQAVSQVVATIVRIPGCGAITAATLAALMPELGRITGRKAAALAGLAPHPFQSGQRNGYRRVRGGRPEVKRALFMAALAASRYNPNLKGFYNRLLNNGKKPIVALTAVMRKLITIINARLRDSLYAPAQN